MGDKVNKLMRELPGNIPEFALHKNKQKGYIKYLWEAFMGKACT